MTLHQELTAPSRGVGDIQTLEGLGSLRGHPWAQRIPLEWSFVRGDHYILHGVRLAVVALLLKDSLANILMRNWDRFR